MPDYMIKALFVLTGLLLLAQIISLLPRVRSLWARALLHAPAGIAALLLGNTLGSLFGLSIGLNALTLPIAAGLGVPGAVLLWFLRYFV